MRLFLAFGPAPACSAASKVDLDDDGYSADDCDDSNPDIYPGADETKMLDNDCDGTVDNDAIDGTKVYLDSDGDGLARTQPKLSRVSWTLNM